MHQRLDHAKKSATNALKASNRVIQKAAEATGDLAGNKINKVFYEVSKNLQQNNSEIVTYEHDKEIPTEAYISPEERQEIIDELRLKQYNNGISKNHKKKSCKKNSEKKKFRGSYKCEDQKVTDFYLFAKNLSKNIGKNINKDMFKFS